MLGPNCLQENSKIHANRNKSSDKGAEAAFFSQKSVSQAKKPALRLNTNLTNQAPPQTFGSFSTQNATSQRFLNNQIQNFSQGLIAGSQTKTHSAHQSTFQAAKNSIPTQQPSQSSQGSYSSSLLLFHQKQQAQNQAVKQASATPLHRAQTTTQGSQGVQKEESRSGYADIVKVGSSVPKASQSNLRNFSNLKQFSSLYSSKMKSQKSPKEQNESNFQPEPQIDEENQEGPILKSNSQIHFLQNHHKHLQQQHTKSNSTANKQLQQQVQHHLAQHA